MSRKPITLDHIPSEHHEGIGLVANSWAYLEGAAERLVWRLARVDDNRGAAITTHMGIRTRLDAACALADLEFSDNSQTTRLKNLTKKILGAALSGKRNEMVHSRTLHIGWSAPGTTLRSTSKARGELKKTLKHPIPEEYSETSKAILAAATELRVILSKFLTMLEERYGPVP